MLETSTFATTVAHLDAIERKPLYHMHPGSRVLTLAAPGCTFRCDYCINYRLSQYGRPLANSWSGQQARPAELVARAQSADAAIGFSYSEPGLAIELTLAIAEAAEAVGVRLIWKTNGFLTAEAIDLVAPVLTAVNIDVKAASDAAHRRLTGASLHPVMDAIERFRAAGVWVEVSTPLIPGTSAEPRELRTIARALALIDPAQPWHIMRFTPEFRMRSEMPTHPDALSAAREIGHAAGLHHVYVERGIGSEARCTRCHACNHVLIERGIWSLVRNEVDDGRCPGCGNVVAGRW